MLNPEEVQSALNFLRLKPAISQDTKELIFYQFKGEMKQKIRPKFFDMLARASSCLDSPSILDIFTKAVNYLHNEAIKFLNLANADAELKSLGLINEILLHLKAVLFVTIDEQTFDVVKTVYKRTFSSFYQLQLRGTDASDQLELCAACEKLKTKCICWSLVEKFRQCNNQLFEMDLLDRLSGEIVFDIAQSTVELQIRTICDSVYEKEHLPVLLQWLESSILTWLAEVYCLRADSAEDLRRRAYDYQCRRLIHYLHEIYAYYLIERLFPIIIDFPDSAPVVNDLKNCMEHVDLRLILTNSLRTSVEKRLLHPGVNTSDVLTAYIQTVKTLRALDPSGILMNNVCQPIRQYLRSRSDTVRCIVSFITETRGLDFGDPDLINQNSRGVNSDSDDDPAEDYRDWRPDPIGAETDSSGKRCRKSADIIGMLVEVYGSRELFVREYSQLLAERLLKQMNYDVENEVRYLELLKLRFGETEMHQCEVMLKDVQNSHRIDAFVKSLKLPRSALGSALILSAQFWPQLKEEALEWPNSIKNLFDAYRADFESLKASRSLDWKPNLGTVELELEFKGRTLEFSVSPVLATLIWQFQEKDKWTIEELALALKASPSVVKKRINWWSTCGVLKFSDGTWRLCDELPLRQRRFSMGIDEEEESDALPNEEDREQQLELYWPYITGLLQNLESLTVERIHSLLKMFGGQKNEELLLDTVHNFLQRKVREQFLIQTGGVYKLSKKL